VKGQFHIVLVLSLAAHGALIVVCPAPSPVESGQAGRKQQITVLGVVQVAAAPEKAEKSQPASAAAVKSAVRPEPDEPPEVLEAKPPEQKPPQEEPEQESSNPQTHEKENQPEPPPAEETHAEVPEPVPEKPTSVQPVNVAALEQSLKKANIWLWERMDRLARNWEDAMAQPRRSPDEQEEPKAEKNVADPGRSEREKPKEQAPKASHPAQKRKREDDRKQEPADSKPSAPRAPTLAEKPSQGVKGSPGSEQTRRGEGEDIRSRYLSRVLRRLQEAKRYPSQARRREIEGRVELELVIRKDGSASPGKILRSSGHDILDDAALQMVERAAPFESLPEELGVERLELMVPVSYTLR